MTDKIHILYSNTVHCSKARAPVKEALHNHPSKEVRLLVSLSYQNLVRYIRLVVCLFFIPFVLHMSPRAAPRQIIKGIDVGRHMIIS